MNSITRSRVLKAMSKKEYCSMSYIANKINPLETYPDMGRLGKSIMKVRRHIMRLKDEGLVDEIEVRDISFRTPMRRRAYRKR